MKNHFGKCFLPGLWKQKDHRTAPTGILPFALAHSTGAPCSQQWGVTPATSTAALQRCGMVNPGRSCSGWSLVRADRFCWKELPQGRSRVNLQILTGYPSVPKAWIQLGSSVPVIQFLSHHLSALKLLSHPSSRHVMVGKWKEWPWTPLLPPQVRGNAYRQDRKFSWSTKTWSSSLPFLWALPSF